MSLDFIMGPCVIESESMTLRIAEELKQISERCKVNITFKASFDKANRTSVDGFRGPGIDKGLQILSNVKKETGLKLLTDIHQISDVKPCAEVVDVMQIPAFLCRQTDLLVAAGQSGCAVNIKKGQFLSPYDMVYAVNKVRSVSQSPIFVTERGSSFGYKDLVVDYRSIQIMKETCQCPVVMDVTHAVQQPGSNGGSTGGKREFVPILAKAAVAVGADMFFLETHPNPNEALSDGPNSWPLDKMQELIEQLLSIKDAISSHEAFII
jgi:2-dehydro-3-deoxyphosphooctonate aldolase (KDO 8-P synthase)